MPKHKQVTTCLKGGGPVSKFCTCNHCTLSVCSVCGAYEGSLTTDCPGETVDFDRQKEVYETNLDYSDARGWHQGDERWPRETHFEPEPVKHEPTLGKPWHANAIIGCSCGWRVPQHVLDNLRNGSTQLDDAFADHVATVAQTAILEEIVRRGVHIDHKHVDLALLRHDLEQKAIAWVHADQNCEDKSAAYNREKEKADAHVPINLTACDRAKIAFHIADERAQECDDEFRQAARKLAAAQGKR